MAKTNANVITVGLLLKLSPTSWFESEPVLILNEIMSFLHVEKHVRKMSSPSQLRSQNEDTDYLRSSVAYAASVVKHHDSGLRYPRSLPYLHVKICSRWAVATAPPNHSFRNFHRSGTQLTRRCEWAPEDFWARNTHGDEAQHYTWSGG